MHAVVQTVHDGRIYTLKIYCDENYPNKVRQLPGSVTAEERVSHGCMVGNEWCKCSSSGSSSVFGLQRCM